MMSSISRYCSHLMLTHHRPYTSIPTATTTNAAAAAADNYWKLLLHTATSSSGGNDFQSSNLEKTLNKVRGKLDSSIVEQTLKRCSTLFTTSPLLALRFFIWAGLQPNYRHTPYMYNKACQFFEIHQQRKTLDDLLETYRKEGCLVSLKTFKVILNLCRQAKLAEEALRVLRKMPKFDCRPDTTVFNVVIGLFCDKGEMDVAQGLMKEMALIHLYPDMSTYIAMIKGFCNVGRLEDACGLVKLMRGHGCVPNVVVYSALLDGLSKVGNLDGSLELLGELENARIPNVVTYTSLIQRFCENGKTVEALAILDRMGSQGCLPNRVTVATLVKHLCNEGKIEEAYKLIDKVLVNGNISKNDCYSSLVMSLLQNKNMAEAEKLFKWMLGNQITPDGSSCSIFLKELCLKGQFLNGFGYYAEMEMMQCLPSIDSDIYSFLLVGLCQQAHLVEAARLIDVMVKRKIKLKAPYADTVVESLEKSGERELALHLQSMRDRC